MGVLRDVVSLRPDQRTLRHLAIDDLRDLAGVLDQQAALSLVQSKIDDNRPEQALLLVELLEGIDDATALSRLRLHVLQQLKDVALQTGNDYELYWLDSEIEKAHETARLIK